MDRQDLLEGKAAYCSYFGVLRKLTNTRQNILGYCKSNIRKLLDKQGNNRTRLNILSFGCGDGAIEVEIINILLNNNRTVNLTCVEPNRHYVEQAWQSFRNASLLSNDKVEVSILPTTIEGFTNSEDKKYDLIILSHVLYYPEDKEQAVLKTLRLLNSSGVVLVFQQAPGGLNEIQRVFSERASIPKRCIYNCYEVEQIMAKHESTYNYKTNIFNQYLDVSEAVASKASGTINDTTMALLSFICEQDFKSKIEDKPELITILNEMVEHITRVALPNSNKPVLFYPTAVTTITMKYKPEQYRNKEYNSLTLKTATLGDLLQFQAETSPRKIFIKTVNTSLTYQATNFTVKALARHLRQLGVKKGDRVGLVSSTSMSAVLLILASWKIGAVIVPLSTILKPEEYLEQVNFVNASFLFISAQWINSHPSHSSELLKSFRGHAFTLNDHDSTASRGCLTVNDFITNTDVDDDYVDVVEPQDEAAILFSSGSTSTPKAIPFTHLGIIFSAESRTRVLSDIVDSENTVLAWLPLNHVMGLMVELVKTALYPGATYAVCPPLDLSLSNGQNLINAIKTMEANVVSVVPYILQQWIQISSSMETLTKMRFILFGGAPIEESTIEYFNSRSVQLIQGYGSTEVGTICISRPKDSPLIFSKMPGYEFKIDPVELDIQPTNGGRIRELLAKGPSITTGYLNNESNNAMNFTADGFYRTGDIFELFDESEDSARLKFVCRNDELLVYPNGEKLNPIPFEHEMLQRSSLVHRMCLILNDQKDTIAVIEPKSPIDREADIHERIFEELSQLQSKLPYYARVSRKNIHVLPNGEVLPVTRKNTVMRHVVRKTILPLLEAQTKSTETSASQVYSNEDITREIRAILSDVLKLPVEVISDDKSLIELGLSSLSAVELTEKLNGISMHVLLASDLYEIKNMRQLVTLVVEGVKINGLENGWLLPLNNAPDHQVKIICLPDLGGEASDFLRYWHDAPSTLQLYAVKIPNRTNYSDELYAKNLEEVAEKFIHDTYNFINSTPFVLYGQCVGGLVAYEIARKFPATGCNLKRIVVASCPSPLDLEAFQREIPSVPTFEDIKRLFSGGGFTEDDGLIDTLLKKTPIVKMAQKDYHVMQDSYRKYQQLKEKQSELLPQFKITYPLSVYKAIEDKIFEDEEVMQWTKFSDDAKINLINGTHDLHTKIRFIMQMYDLALM